MTKDQWKIIGAIWELQQGVSQRFVPSERIAERTGLAEQHIVDNLHLIEGDYVTFTSVMGGGCVANLTSRARIEVQERITAYNLTETPKELLRLLVNFRKQERLLEPILLVSEPNPTEYNSWLIRLGLRDGGLVLNEIIPEAKEHDFDVLVREELLGAKRNTKGETQYWVLQSGIDAVESCFTARGRVGVVDLFQEGLPSVINVLTVIDSDIGNLAQAGSGVIIEQSANPDLEQSLSAMIDELVTIVRASDAEPDLQRDYELEALQLKTELRKSRIDLSRVRGMLALLADAEGLLGLASRLAPIVLALWGLIQRLTG